MIVITSLSRTKMYAEPGDTFRMTVADNLGFECIINEEVTVERVIDYVASFRFALEDGTCPGFHLTGIFANSKELPEEIRNAVMFEDLSQDQKERFAASVGVKINE